MIKKTPAVLSLFAGLAMGFGVSTAASAANKTSAHTPILVAQQTPTESSSVGEAISDTWITTKVRTELVATKGVETDGIAVQTNDGVVILTGVINDDVARKKAIAAAESIKGVKRVDASGLKVGAK